MRKRKQARKVGNREPLSLRFHPKMKRTLDGLAKKDDENFSAFATSVCGRFLDGRLVLKERPPMLPEEGREGTSVVLDPEIELRLADEAVEQEWQLAYLVRRILEWRADGWLIEADSKRGSRTRSQG